MKWKKIELMSMPVKNLQKRKQSQICRKSALWDESLNSELIFYNTTPHKLRFVSYELRKKKY